MLNILECILIIHKLMILSAYIIEYNYTVQYSCLLCILTKEIIFCYKYNFFIIRIVKASSCLHATVFTYLIKVIFIIKFTYFGIHLGRSRWLQGKLYIIILYTYLQYLWRTTLDMRAYVIKYLPPLRRGMVQIRFVNQIKVA